MPAYHHPLTDQITIKGLLKRWHLLSPYPPERALVQLLLDQRGLTAKETQHRFLHPELERDLHDPYLMPDMQIALDRIKRALDANEHILVFGDYDVDGVTATAMMMDFLAQAKAKASFILPHRQKDGFGLSVSGVEQAIEQKADLVITVDNGTSAYEALELAHSQALDVIITDHHQPGLERPKATAVVNPNRKDSHYPFGGLAGVGVAYKLLQAICPMIWDIELARRSLHAWLDLVCLGTVADVAPLVDENRTLVYHGLQTIASSGRPGIQALREVSWGRDKPVDTQTIGFHLAPRLNAAGRLGEAEQALQLLMAKDPEEAKRLAMMLDETNRVRQQLNVRGQKEAQLVIESEGLLRNKILILKSPKWHKGIVGLIAGRLCETYSRPTIIFREDEQRLEGSARSIPGYDIATAIARFDDLLVSHGGHPQAAGVTVDASHYEPFRQGMQWRANSDITDDDLVPTVEIAAMLQGWRLTKGSYEEIQGLAPFGQGNREPMFGIAGAKVIDVRTMGRDDSHLKLKVEKEGEIVECVWWRMGEMFEQIKLGAMVDLAFTMELNEWQGKVSLQLKLEDVCIPPTV